MKLILLDSGGGAGPLAVARAACASMAVDPDPGYLAELADLPVGRVPVLTRWVQPSAIGEDGLLTPAQLRSWRDAGYAVVSGIFSQFSAELITAAVVGSEETFALPTKARPAATLREEYSANGVHEHWATWRLQQPNLASSMASRLSLHS